LLRAGNAVNQRAAVRGDRVGYTGHGTRGEVASRQ
jgi:hypothetical protein